MLQKHHLFRKIVCLFMAFALLLIQTGCGTQSEEIDSSKTTNETAASDPDAEEAKDKFVMLKEVYDILSGPLGERYRTPEYWGGEEIDMMRVGDGYDDYLIGLRNVQNEMHYLLYEKDSASIVEIDTEGKHIPWDEILYNNSKQEISFPYYIVDDVQTQKVRQGTVIYSLTNHSYQYIEATDLSLVRPENLFEIPDPILTQENQTYTFDFLTDIIEKLPEIYLTDQPGWVDFGQMNICILNHNHSTLICLEGQTKHYYLYQRRGTISAIIPLDVPNTFWDVIRFQQDEEYIVLPSPSGQEFPYVYWDSADFPYTTLVSLDTPTWSEKQRTPLWKEEEAMIYQVGKSSCRSEWNAVLYWDNLQAFALHLAESKNSACDCAEHAPEIIVETNPDHIVSVWIKNGKISNEIQQDLLSCQTEGITDIQIQQNVYKEYHKKDSSDVVKETGDQIQFILKNGYQLYGEFQMDEDYFSYEGKLQLLALPIGSSSKEYYQISNYQYFYLQE